MTMMKKVSTALVASLMIIGASQPAKASSLDEAFWLQKTLQFHGFDVGRPDGKIGPQTRAAIGDFAEKYNFPSEPKELLQAIFSRSAQHSFNITREANLDDEVIQQITDTIAEKLRDPSSVQVRNIRLVQNDEGKFFCGEVNGKNAYGAYAGFNTFRTLSESRLLMIAFLDISGDTTSAFWTCNLAIPKIY